MTAHVPRQLESIVSKTDHFLAKYPLLFQYEQLKKLESKTGYSKVYFFFLFSVILGAVVYFLGGSKLLTNLVAFIYPAYMSFKAIESHELKDDTQWLTYWVVFAFATIVENCAGFLIEYIPYYNFLKQGFFVWLYHPKSLGASAVYGQLIRPHIIPFVKSIEKKAS